MAELSPKVQEKIVAQLKEWAAESLGAREEVAGKDYSNWDDYEYYYTHGSRTAKQTPWWWAEVKINLLRARVDRIVGLYTGERPRITFTPQEPLDNLLAEYLTGLCENDWATGGVDRELRYVMTDASILGTGIWKTWYDEVPKRIRTRRINPRNFICDPSSDPSLKDAEFVGEVSEIPYSKVLALHPEIEKDERYRDEGQIALSDSALQFGQPLPSMSRAQANLNQTGLATPGTTTPSQSLRRRMQYGQFYVRRIASIEWALDDKAREALKQDEITDCFLVTVVGNRIVDISKPKTGKQWHPYTVFRAGIRTNSWWGEGDVVGLMKAQDGLDIMLSRICQHIQATVNPWYVGNMQMRGDLPSNIAPVPNEVIWVSGSPNEAIVAQRPPDLPGAALGVLDHVVSFLDDRSGVEPSVRGRHQPGVTSGTQEQALQQQLAERNKPRLDDRDESLKSFGTRYCDLALAVYSEEHAKRVLGKDKANDWDKLKSDAKGDFDVKIEVGAGISGDPEGVMKLALDLNDRQILGPPEDPRTRIAVLDIVSKVWPGAQALIRDLKREQEAIRDQEAQGMVAGSTPAPPVAPAPPGAPPAPPMPQAQPQLAGVA